MLFFSEIELMFYIKKNQNLSIFKKTMYGAIQRGQDEGIKMPPTGMT